MLPAPSPASSSRTESGSSFSSRRVAAVRPQPVQSAPASVAASRGASARPRLGAPRPAVASARTGRAAASAPAPGCRRAAWRARTSRQSPGRCAMLGVELAHHHHALPVRDRHQDRAAAALAELAEGLRRLVLLVGREVARPQHEAVLAHHGRQHPVELALEAAALRRPVAQEDARLGGKARLVPQASGRRPAGPRRQLGRLTVRSTAPPHSSRASASAPVRTSSSPWSSDGISASDCAVKRSHSSRKSIGAAVARRLVGACAPPKPSAAASVEMKPPLLLGLARGVARRPPARARASAPAPGCAASRGR